jgi:hypothetical protein
VKCPLCMSEIADNSEKCSLCGNELMEPCPFCHDKVPVDAKQCMHCNSPLQTVSPSVVEAPPVESSPVEGARHEPVAKLTGNTKWFVVGGVAALLLIVAVILATRTGKKEAAPKLSTPAQAQPSAEKPKVPSAQQPGMLEVSGTVDYCSGASGKAYWCIKPTDGTPAVLFLEVSASEGSALESKLNEVQSTKRLVTMSGPVSKVDGFSMLTKIVSQSF